MNYFRSNRFLDTLCDWETGDRPDGPLENYLPRMRALLDRLGNPQTQFTSVIVSGTNGKGTVSSLLADLIRASGHRVGLYSSPHLHTIRERIQVDGEIVKKNLWSEGVTFLYEKGLDFDREGLGAFSKFEAITALAAHLFAREGVAYGIFEVGLGGRFDATNAWDSDLAILTRIQLDHTDILGNSLEAIAADKVHIARSGRALLTTDEQAPEVLAFLERECERRDISFCLVGDTCAEDAWPGRIFDLAMGDRSATFVQNARLALFAGHQLLGKELTYDLAQDVLKTHHWPGRFEVIDPTPPLVLDGAHNPGAAQALATELGKMAEGWTFVVGVNEGHDAAGILEAIAPLAREMILTRSSHPRALPVEALMKAVPDTVSVRCEANSLSFLKATLPNRKEGKPICVMGSLYLVAQAREVLDLPLERDGFSEDVFLESLACLKAACQNLGVDVRPVSADGNVVRLMQGIRPVHFLRNRHPFNDYVAGHLAGDKSYQYELFRQAGLPVPYTLSVFNPLAISRFDRYQTHSSVEAIVEDVERQFTYPVVIKRNQSSMAQGVYLETDRAGLLSRLQELCESSGLLYNVFLIQTFVEGPEYRIVASGDRLLLAYEKVVDWDGVVEDLNPLHQAGGKAIRVTHPELLQAMADLPREIHQVLNLGFYAVDAIRSKEGFQILEINANPICHFYNADNGREDFVRIYEYLIRKYILDVPLSESDLFEKISAVDAKA
ncbi:MAG: Mur ligase family protein [bacterium]|nr:Mur ligase family protein [bacterium]